MSIQLTKEYLAESRQASLYASNTITYFGAFAAVALRFWSRRIKKAGYWIDDWLCVAAMICATGMFVNFYWWVGKGYGKHREANGPDVDYNFFLGFFLAEVIYTFIVVFAKYSILALYWRVFRIESIKWRIWTLVAIVSAWGIAVLLLSIFTCVPPKAFWDKSTPNAYCGVDNKAFLWGISIPNIATDVTILLIPVPYVLRLKTGWSQKRLLLGTFLLGGFVCIASIMRLVSVIHQDQGPDASWNWVDQGIWANMESNFAIISACLPTMRPIWLCMFKPREPTASSEDLHDQVCTVGGSGPASKRSRKKLLDESFLTETVNSVTHPFEQIPEESGGTAKMNAIEVSTTVYQTAGPGGSFELKKMEEFERTRQDV